LDKKTFGFSSLTSQSGNLALGAKSGVCKVVQAMGGLLIDDGFNKKRLSGKC